MLVKRALTAESWRRDSGATFVMMFTTMPAVV